MALHVALERPDLVTSMVLISANFHFDGIVSMDEVFVPGAPALASIAEAYAAISPDGAEHFPVVVDKTLAMFKTQPTLTVEDLGRISHPVLVLAADDDAVFLGHTCALFEALPQAQLAIVPAASHLLVFERPDQVQRAVREFLDSDGVVETLWPIRRGP